jgi:hypothetical protein
MLTLSWISLRRGGWAVLHDSDVSDGWHTLKWHALLYAFIRIFAEVLLSLY